MIREDLKATLDHARFVRLLTSYLIGLIIFLFTTIPHKWWVWVTIMVVSGAFESGLIIRKSFLRIRGSLSALLLIIPLLYIMQLNYRMIPIAFILSGIGLAVSSMNPRRYDIFVFFTTLFVFFILSQTALPDTDKSPIDMVLNRAICTAIGIFIVFACDYFLFDPSSTSQKKYLLQQIEICALFDEKVHFICQRQLSVSTAHLCLRSIHHELNRSYEALLTSANDLHEILELSPPEVGAPLKQEMEAFLALILELRELVFGLIFSKFIQKSEEITTRYLNRYNELIHTARSLFAHIIDIK